MPFRGNFFARNSLVCLDVGFFICRFSSMRFHLNQNRRCGSCCCSFSELFDCFLENVCVWCSYSRRFSAFTYHLFTAFSSAWLSHKYNMGFVTGVPRNAKIQAASCSEFELDPSSSRPTLHCCFFLFFRRISYPAQSPPPFLLDPSPVVTVPQMP